MFNKRFIQKNVFQVQKWQAKQVTSSLKNFDKPRSSPVRRMFEVLARVVKTGLSQNQLELRKF